MNKDISNISTNSHEISNNSSSFEQPRDADDVFEPAADENNAAEKAQEPKRKRGNARQYIDWKKFDNAPAYHEFWDKEKENWSKRKDSNKDTIYWNCKYSAKKERLSQIQNILRQNNVTPLPKLSQVQNFVKRETKKGGQQKFTFEDLLKYATESKCQKEEVDKAYVLNCVVDTVENRFCIIWTTPKLLQQQLDHPLLQVDSTFSLTYNLIWNEEFPVQVAGFSDVNKRFHPTLIALSSNENQFVYNSIFTTLQEMEFEPHFVMGDGAKAITAAVETTWPESIRLMCYAHVYRNVEKHLGALTDQEKKRIKDDLCRLQMTRNEEEFIKVGGLMLLAWHESGMTPQADYLYDSWYKSKEFRWFEGASPFVANNNGLESANKIIKEVDTFRRRLKISQFLKTAEDIVQRWSINSQEIATFPYIGHDYYRTAYALFTTHKPLWGKPKDQHGDPVYYFSSTTADLKSAAELKAAAMITGKNGGDWETWDEYDRERFKVYITNWSEYGRYITCSCPMGSKKNVCKHAVVAMVNEGILTFPTGLKDALPLQGTKKKGRPRKSEQGRPPKAPKQRNL